ncbi:MULTISPECIES: hypothetical protein [Citrobacter]|nr:hypothetical protein [Citrobacter freundii complex sp. 2023EL-00966]MDT3752471.1 hypothetical protein [Citrobacter freundii complex sp. 2023EL-00966]
MALADKPYEASRHRAVKGRLNFHAAEKRDDFVNQFHVDILFLSELIM